MRADQVHHFAPLPEERMTIPSLGGDGVVIVRSIGFGAKMQIGLSDPEQRASLLLSHCVRDEDGRALLTAAQWDTFGMQHEDDFLTLSQVAARVSALGGDEAKKD